MIMWFLICGVSVIFSVFFIKFVFFVEGCFWFFEEGLGGGLEYGY